MALEKMFSICSDAVLQNVLTGEFSSSRMAKYWTKKSGHLVILFLNASTLASFYLFLALFKHKFYRKTVDVSRIRTWIVGVGRRRAHWPLDHHHSPYLVILNVALDKICLAQSQQQVGFEPWHSRLWLDQSCKPYFEISTLTHSVIKLELHSLDEWW